jgi:hypothetical protein
VNDSGTIYVTDNTVGIMAVDHGTGNRAEVSGGGAGSGTAFDGELWDIDYLSDGTLVVTDAFTELGSPGDTMIEGIFTVNPNTGARAILSSTAVGSGDAFPAGGVQHLAVMRNPVPVELSVFQTD